MLKEILGHIENELKAAERYIDSAFDKKSHDPETANLFANIAQEELQHAERLLKQGQILCDKFHVEQASEPEASMTSAMNGKITSYGASVHQPHMRHIWHWEKDKAHEDIADLKTKIQSYKSVM